jgi:hypothetical protein
MYLQDKKYTSIVVREEINEMGAIKTIKVEVEWLTGHCAASSPPIRGIFPDSSVSIDHFLLNLRLPSVRNSSRNIRRAYNCKRKKHCQSSKKMSFY